MASFHCLWNDIFLNFPHTASHLRPRGGGDDNDNIRPKQARDATRRHGGGHAEGVHTEDAPLSVCLFLFLFLRFCFFVDYI